MPDPISWEFAWPYLTAAFAGGYLLGAIPFGLVLTRLAGLGMMQVVSYAIAMYAGAFQGMDPEIQEFFRLIRLEKTPSAEVVVAGSEVTYTYEVFNTGSADLENLVVEDDRGLDAVNGLSVTVNAGEVVGIAGVSGNGQRELAQGIVAHRDALAELEAGRSGVRHYGPAGETTPVRAWSTMIVRDGAPSMASCAPGCIGYNRSI